MTPPEIKSLKALINVLIQSKYQKAIDLLYQDALID